MRFRSPYTRSENIRSTPVGSRYYNEGRVIFDPDGNMHLETGKERDRFIEIQSYKDSCDVNLMIKRYENGDQTALLRSNTGVYCDISSMPKNVHDAVKLSRSVETLYNSLGDDVKKIYPSVNDFTAAFSSNDNFISFVENSKSIIKSRVEKVNANKPKKDGVDNA